MELKRKVAPIVSKSFMIFMFILALIDFSMSLLKKLFGVGNGGELRFADTLIFILLLAVIDEIRELAARFPFPTDNDQQ